MSKIEKEISELNKSCREKHLLKFGDVVDLDYIKCLAPSSQYLELDKKMAKESALIS